MKLSLIVNPNAGKKRGLAVAQRASRQFEDAGIQTEMAISEEPGQTLEIAKRIEPDAADGVVAVGGDGTLFEVINGVLSQGASSSLPVGQIPIGTGNSFLKDIDEDATRVSSEGDMADPVARAVARITRNTLRNVDVGHFSSETDSYYFINLLGAGFVSNVAYRAGKYKMFGSFSYIFGVLEEVIRLDPTPITLTIDGVVIKREGIFVEICNSRFTGGNMMMAPSARIDDGVLDIVLLNRVSRGKILKLLPTIFEGKHVDDPAVEVFQGKNISLQAERPLSLTPDGETFGHTPIDVTIHPHKLRMYG